LEYDITSAQDIATPILLVYPNGLKVIFQRELIKAYEIKNGGVRFFCERIFKNCDI
jgi:hypothetical protein